MERRVNTLMAGVNGARSARGRYTQAGYSAAQADRQMYIADVAAGSAQDNLRDLNRIGYRSSRPWNETPTPVFEAAAAAPSAPAPRRREKKLTFAEKFAYHAGRERGDVIACILLAAVILMMTAAWGQKLVAGAQIQNRIAAYQRDTVSLEKQNEELEKALEQARSDSRIHSLAQNELQMLRKERAQTETIYIQMPENTTDGSLQHTEEPRMELLDILLGLLNVFHIGE